MRGTEHKARALFSLTLLYFDADQLRLAFCHKCCIACLSWLVLPLSLFLAVSLSFFLGYAYRRVFSSLPHFACGPLLTSRLKRPPFPPLFLPFFLFSFVSSTFIFIFILLLDVLLLLLGLPFLLSFYVLSIV